jgi:hypothetical protein
MCSSLSGTPYFRASLDNGAPETYVIQVIPNSPRLCFTLSVDDPSAFVQLLSCPASTQEFGRGTIALLTLASGRVVRATVSAAGVPCYIETGVQVAN